MENKEIYIDGVDVSRCECFYINDSHPERKECINPYCKGLCKENPNCYYKQLKRKEQECERLKEEVSLLKESNLKLQPMEDVSSLEKYYLQQLDQLKAENEQLKNFHINLVGVKECEIKELANYKQAIEKIKEIAYLLNDRTMVRKDICDRLDEILQICDEVNDER